MYANYSHILLYVVIVYTTVIILVIIAFYNRLQRLRRKEHYQSFLPQHYLDFVLIPRFPKSFQDIHDGGKERYEGSTARLVKYIANRQKLIGRSIIPIFDEYNLIREYIELIKGVSNKEISLISNADPSINLKSTYIPAGIILLFVESAFKTELDELDDFYIKIGVSKTGDCVSVVVGYSCKDNHVATNNINMCSQHVWMAMENLNKINKTQMLFSWSHGSDQSVKVTFIIPKSFCN